VTAATATRPQAGTRTFPVLAIAEVAFALVTLATVVSLRRVFVGGEWFAPLLVHVVAGHGTVTFLRRRQVAAPVAAVGAAVAAVVVIAWVHAGQATTFGIPTLSTIDVLVASAQDAFAQFGDIKAPTEPLQGFLVASAVAIWASAVVGDWAAFRADATIEAVLPAAALFGVASVLGADVGRVVLAGVWIGTVLTFVLVRRADRLGRTSTWVGDQRSRGPRALVLLGVVLALVATAVAAVVGPRLPGAEAEAVVSLTDLGDDAPGTRVTVSPLVDIRSRLVQQANVEVFTVRSDVRSYWRLTSLDRFDGSIWSSNGSYGKSSGDLDDGVSVASERIVFDQGYAISALSQIWLPAAYEPQAVKADEPVRYDEVSGTIIVDTDVPTSDGTTYTVRSALPQHRPEALAQASTDIPTDIAELYLALPPDFSPDIRALAAEITAGSTTRYEQALRLQNFFREQFTYDIDIDLDHAIGDMEQFLFDVRAGYCEQFAGSFAAMARSLGLPARVGVGFTAGVNDPDDPSLFRVRGEHAHAWPEVYFGELGWVIFEPTPGRGAPFAEQYTGVPEQQAQSGGGGNTATTLPATPTTAPATPDTPIPEQTPPTFPEESGVDVGGGADGSEPNPWPARVAVGLVIVVGAIVLYLLGVIAAGAAGRALRRQRADTAVARIALAWDESLAAARRAGVGVHPSATQRQAAEEIARRIPDVDEPIRALASTVESTAFSPTVPDDDAGQAALLLADRVGEGMRASMTPRARFRTRFDPRLLRRR
jgi:transglutaminase-like putative cysteine protease